MNIDNNNLLENDSSVPTEESKETIEENALSFKLERIEEQLNTLQVDFQGKIKYDQHKEKIIDNLHSELQEYKNDLIKKLLQPMIMDVIHTIDDVKKLINHYQEQSTTEIDPQKLLKLMESIPDDLEHLLYRQGVETFNCSETMFNPNRQRAIKNIAHFRTGQRQNDCSQFA
ncbi:GrpE protein HSP-70 cofactor [Beggiatoa sp. PS]|nr:GrpE protein HSP-70 cofactor [Beggiatoa sp. PS]